MTFIHPLLLGGLLLAGLPVLLHLIMRQQPKHLIFPAFRFLQLRQRTNQRKLRLRHIILLADADTADRADVPGLARPKLFSDRFGFLGDEQAATVVLVMDTGPSMEYTAGGKTRLEDAKARAQELLDDLGESSRIAILDTADPIPEWALSRTAARERLANLSIRAGNRPVTDALDAAFRMFSSAEFQEPGDDTKPRFVYVFSDRTPASWENAHVADLKTSRDRLPDPKPRLVYVDVGVESPADNAVADVVAKPQAVSANQPVVLQVTVQATGQPCEGELSCQFGGDPADRKPVHLKAGDRQVIEFERRDLTLGYHQATVQLRPDDNLKANNFRYATVLVREPRKVLVLCDELQDARLWRSAVNRQKLYLCDVKSINDPGMKGMAPSDLAAYQAVCLVNVRAVGETLWANLEAYVNNGGGLAVAPGGRELDKDDYSKEGSAALRILPGELEQFVVNRGGVGLIDYQYQHRLLAKFRDWVADPRYSPAITNAQAYQYWVVKPTEGATVLIRYADADKHPALLEKSSTKLAGRGKVLLFTTPMDGRKDATGRPANNFMADWFYFGLVNEAVKYLAGETDDASLNFPAGPAIVIPLPLDKRFSTYTLSGSGLTGVRYPSPAGRIRERIAADATAAAGPICFVRRPRLVHAVQRQHPTREVPARASHWHGRYRGCFRPRFRCGGRPNQTSQGCDGRPIPPTGGIVSLVDDSVVAGAGAGKPVGE